MTWKKWLGKILYLFSGWKKHSSRSQAQISRPSFYLISQSPQCTIITVLINTLSCSDKCSASCQAKLEWFYPLKKRNVDRMWHRHRCKNWTATCYCSARKRPLEYSISSPKVEKRKDRNGSFHGFSESEQSTLLCAAVAAWPGEASCT